MLLAAVQCIGPCIIWLAAFIFSLVWHGRCPSWVLIVALIPATLDLVQITAWLLNPGEDSRVLPAALAACLIAALAVLLWSLRSRLRGPSKHTSAPILGLALQLPAMVLFVWLFFIVITIQPQVG